jgi:hypothetical protein
MATRDEDIAELKAEIAGYETKLNSASSEDMIKLYGKLIIAARRSLSELREEKRVATTAGIIS